MMHNTEHAVKIVDVQLYKENGQYYLNVKAERETADSVDTVVFPKLQLFDGNPNDIWLSITNEYCCGYKIELGPNYYYAIKGRYDDLIRKLLKEKGEDKSLKDVMTDVDIYAYFVHSTPKTKEMTLKEIEKKLGHKVKIVAEKK